MWEIAADKSREIWHRYFAAAKLIEMDPSNARWSEIIPDLIAAHDFASDPSLFHSVGQFDLDSKLKEQFRVALIRKIDRSSESNIPTQLLQDFFNDNEVSNLIVLLYLEVDWL